MATKRLVSSQRQTGLPRDPGTTSVSESETSFGPSPFVARSAGDGSWLGDLLSVAGLAMHLVADHLVGNVVQVRRQRRVNLLELGPKRALHEGARRLDDDSLTLHAHVAERLQAVPAAERDEQPARPWIRDAEAHFNLGLRACRCRQLQPDPFGGRAGRLPLSGRSCACEKSLDLAQLIAQVRLVDHLRLPRIAPSRGDNAPAC